MGLQNEITIPQADIFYQEIKRKQNDQTGTEASTNPKLGPINTVGKQSVCVCAIICEHVTGKVYSLD